MRTYVITGSASGIGLASRRLLEARGDRVIGVDLRDAEIVLDLTDARQRLELAGRLRSLGVDRLDGVVPSAGVGPYGSTEPVVRLNYFGALETVLQLRSMLASSAAPRVCMVCSVALLWASADVPSLTGALAEGEEAAVAAFATAECRSAYAVTKRAIARFVRATAVESSWIADGILVNAVAPAIIATNMTAQVWENPEKLAPRLEELPHPHGIGKAEDVAALIGFLVSRENGFVNGQIVFVDGGHEALTCGPEPGRYP